MPIDELVKKLQNDGVIVIPTDTVYGISCSVNSEVGMKKINKAKKREIPKPFNILVSDKEMLKEYVVSLSPLEEQLINKYTPNKVTFLLKKNSKISDLVTSASPLVGIRVPDREDLRELIKKLGSPIVSTSANVTGSDVVSDLDELDEEFFKQIDYTYYEGKMNTTASTIIKVEDEKIIFLREGEMANLIKKEFNNYLK